MHQEGFYFKKKMHQEGRLLAAWALPPLLLSKMGKKGESVQKVTVPGPETGRAGEGVQRAAVKIIFPLLIPQPCCGDKGEQSLQSPQIGARPRKVVETFLREKPAGGILPSS